MNKKTLAVWQPVGYSTHQITVQIARKLKTKATHTGTLDPMAEGVILILLGENRFNKRKYTQVKKEYVFDLVLGISTDTHDGMGLITNENLSYNFQRSDLKKITRNLRGLYSQKVPLYSAIKTKGKSMFEKARNEEVNVKVPVKEGRIYKIGIVSIKKIALKKHTRQIISNINKVSGDFRQNQIIESWENFLSSNEKSTLTRIRIKVTTSSGIYVRGIARDICETLGINGFVSNLTRTKNGKFSKRHCEELRNIFGNNFDHSLLKSRVGKIV